MMVVGKWVSKWAHLGEQNKVLFMSWNIVCSKINNGLLNLNMGLDKKVVDSNMVWTFEKK
jgi:hypothetical protein